MQGRLSPIVNNQIQCFPIDNWHREFQLANRIKLNLMEWTLDNDKIYSNPLMNIDGRKKILELSEKNNIEIKSLTGDCFMQKPFWKKTPQQEILKNTFIDICYSCNEIGIRFIVIPLVDEGSINNEKDKSNLISFLLKNISLFRKLSLVILFESDFDPENLFYFIKDLPSDVFGINYDVGNSASLGYKPIKEFDFYGDRILNVHIKDRKYKGNTVPLGEGDADFKTVFSLLKQYNYCGNLILQAARSINDQHLEVLEVYKHFVLDWINNS